eukprot:2205946-Rhodomonas_salina.3
MDLYLWKTLMASDEAIRAKVDKEVQSPYIPTRATPCPVQSAVVLLEYWHALRSTDEACVVAASIHTQNFVSSTYHPKVREWYQHALRLVLQHMQSYEGVILPDVAYCYGVCCYDMSAY